MMKFITILLLNITLLFGLSGRAVKIVDGDTILILTPDKKEVKIRLYGIDAPERKQAFGRKSKDFLSGMIAGEHVIVDNKGVDRYNRVLGVIYFNNEDINAKMVRSGYAWAFKRYSKDYIPQEVKAKKEKLGLWSDDRVIAPWEFRKNR